MLAARKNHRYVYIDELVRAAIREEAFQKIKLTGTRTGNVERAEILKETFAEPGAPDIPSDLVGIMSSYVTGKEPEKTKKEGRTETQKQGKR